MAQAQVPLPMRPFGRTSRRGSLVGAAALSSLVCRPSSFTPPGRPSRASITTTLGRPYLSPFYSPEIFGDSGQAGSAPSRAGGPAGCPSRRRCSSCGRPGGFRVTCYYYRGAYYKAFWADPPACTVGEPRKTYLGEASLAAHHAEHPPLLPLPGAPLPRPLAIDVWDALWFTDPAPGSRSASASAPWCCRSTSILLSGYTLRLPFAAAPGRRPPRRHLRAPQCRHTAYDCVELPQPPAHALGLVQPVLGRLHRPLRAAVLDGHLERLEDHLDAGTTRRTSTTSW